MNLAKKILVGALCSALIMSATVVGTLAYLTDTSEKVVNTFTVGNVSIKLDETKVDEYGNSVDEDEDGNPDKTTTGNSYKMIPGREYLKDPMVTVAADSESCWLFVKVEESTDFQMYMDYGIDTAWISLNEQDYPGVYYREVEKQLDAEGTPLKQEFNVLADNKITIDAGVTSDMVKDLTPETYPTLTITAYAVQHEGIDSEVAAWAIIEEENKPTEEPSVETPTNPAP